MSQSKVLCSCLGAGLFRKPVEKYITALMLALLADDAEYPTMQALAQRREGYLTTAEIKAARQVADLMFAEVRNAS